MCIVRSDCDNRIVLAIWPSGLIRGVVSLGISCLRLSAARVGLANSHPKVSWQVRLQLRVDRYLWFRRIGDGVCDDMVQVQESLICLLLF